MGIKAITVNAAGMAPERNVQGNRPKEKAENSLFGPECRVTLSREGRKLSRQREEDEYYKNIKNGYLEELKEIDDKINALNTSYEKKKGMDETIEKQQEVLRAMRNQKQYQMEENQRRAKEAQQMAAMQSGKYQEEIDENNREIRTLLKTIEEAEKTVDQRENGRTKEDGNGGSNSGAKNSASGVIRNSANQFTISSIRREQDVEKMIAGLNEEGHRYLDLADSITQAVLKENERARRALEQEDITVEEMAELMSPIRDRITSGIYKEVEDYRGWGLQILQDALDCKLQHIADDSLRGMAEAKKSMMLSAEDAVFHEAMQGKLEEASGELEEEVKELIDERNKADEPRPDEEDEEGISTIETNSNDDIRNNKSGYEGEDGEISEKEKLYSYIEK